MDSLTQITLGAAVGEVLLGKKLGNKAILWGAFGGTVPDLDIIGNFFMNDVQALAFHRGITHSIFFAIVASLPLGWLLSSWYKQSFRSNKSFKWFKWSLFLIAYLGLVFGLFSVFDFLKASNAWLLIVIGLLLGVVIFRRYYYEEVRPPDPGYTVSFKAGYLLFFWAIITHIALDVFTSFGTQVFKPFSDYRLALGSISVVDPLYTIPFLSTIIAASFLNRTKRLRRILVWSGIAISTGYLLFTVYNKHRVESIFKATLADQGHHPDRIYVTPYILNNILWHCVAEENDGFHIGAYSLFDQQKATENITYVKKNDHLLEEIKVDPDVKTLQWFSNNYYSIMREANSIYLGDLRYGNSPSDYIQPSDYVFIFKIDKSDQGIVVTEMRNREDIGPRFRTMWKRIKGI